MTIPTTAAGRALLDDPMVIADLIHDGKRDGAERYVALIEAEARAAALDEARAAVEKARKNGIAYDQAFAFALAAIDDLRKRERSGE